MPVADCWNDIWLDWDLRFRRGIRYREFESWLGLVLMIDAAKVGDGIDRAYWYLESSGIFSTRSAFHKITETNH